MRTCYNSAAPTSHQYCSVRLAYSQKLPGMIYQYSVTQVVLCWPRDRASAMVRAAYSASYSDCEPVAKIVGKIPGSLYRLDT